MVDRTTKEENLFMVKKVSTKPFQGTPEQKAQLDAVIAEHKHDPSKLKTVMQKAQGIYGYLPYEVQAMIADGMNAPLETVYGISTFYAQFALTPSGRYVVSVCMGTACYVKRAQEILDIISDKLEIPPGECTEDGEFSIDACRCIGACGLAPVITIGEDVYGNLEPEDVSGIMDKYIKK